MPTRRIFPSLAAALLVAAAGAAQAGQPEVRWSVTIGSPMPAVMMPAPAPVVVPVYGMPGPYHAHPAPPAPRHVYGKKPGSRWDRDRDGIPDRNDRRHRHDADGDGIPNRHDRVYNPRWDRDGDGIPNRHDPYPNHPYRAWGR